MSAFGRWRAALHPPGPLRRLGAATFVTSVGNGAWFTSWAVFLVRSVGLSPGSVGLGLLVSGALGTLLSTPVGHLADRRGPRGVVVAIAAVEAASFLGYTAVHGLPGFLAVATITGTCATAGVGARRAFAAGLAGPARRMRVMAAQRVVSHAGQALGAIGGAVVISLDDRTAYVALIAANAATFAAFALVAARLPAVPPLPREADRPGAIVLRDRPYLALAGLMGVLTLCWSMLSTGVPLWVALHTGAPRATSAALVLLNCLGIVALQSRVAAGTRSPGAAARAAVLSGGALAAACAILAASGALPPATAAAAIVLAGAVHLAGELLYVAASWGLSLAFLREDARGQYLAVFATGEAAAVTAGPAIMTTLIAGAGAAGWLVLGAVFLLAGLATVPATRRAAQPAAALATPPRVSSSTMSASRSSGTPSGSSIR